MQADPELERVRVLPRDVLKKSVFDEVIGLGPLEELLEDEAVTEIMVNRHNEIFIERSGRLAQSSVIFTDDRAVLGAIERIVAPLGRRIDESSPMVDARLKDGSRVNAVIPPLALKGPNITIRKFSKRKLHGSDLVQFGSLSPQMVEFLRVAVERRANIVISGGTGSGKTTLLNVLSNFIPEDERIVTVEDAAELQLLVGALDELRGERVGADLSLVAGRLGVAAGAFGAHGLKAHFAANGQADNWETAVRYCLFHAVALLVVAAAWWPARWGTSP